MIQQFQKTLVITLLCGILLPNYAFAKTPWYASSNWYTVVTIGTGAAISSNISESKSFPIQDPITDEAYNYSIDHGSQIAWLGQIFVGVEGNIHPNWLLQLGLDYTQTSPFDANGTFVQGADSGSSDTYSYQYNVLTRQLLLEGKLLYAFKEIVHPYLLVGLGAAFNKAYDYGTNVPSTLTFTRMYGDHSNTSFSYAVGTGVDIDINTDFRLGVGYRFVNLGRAELGNATIDTTSVNGTLSQSNIYANELFAQLTWIA